MKRIFRGLETYGDGSPSEQATRFRLAELFPEVIERARKNSKTWKGPRVDLLVSLSGFSPATTILAFELLRPKRLFVISSASTETSIDVIAGHLLGERLPMRYFRHKSCDGTDPLAIYRLVKEEVGSLAEGGRRRSAMIDITGGKKVMSAAAALVAWQLDLRLCYIDSSYDEEMRQPIPGTERLLILENPTTIFGDQELDAALETFRSGAFAVAREKFATLAESMTEPSRARLLRDLSALYQAWTDLDLPRLPELSDRVAKGLADPLTRVSSATATQLSEQLAYIAQLTEASDLRGMPNFYVLGEHYRGLGRTDFAALLYYRTVEGCFQQRLDLTFKGFDTSDARYELMGVPGDELLTRFNEVLSWMKRPAVTALPTRIGFMDSAVLLHVHGDSLLERINVRDVKGLSYLSRLTEARNRSVLAHGHHSVSSRDCDSLRDLALRCLRALWSLHQPGEDIDALCKTLRFVRDV